MVVCASCGTENPEGARFCYSCGSAIGVLVEPARESRKTVTVLFCDLRNYSLFASLNADQLVQAIFACWWLGAVACPLNTRWSAPELLHALDDSEASLLLVDASLAQAAPEATTPRLSLDELAGEARSQQPLPDKRAGGNALAAILYTGGTTGRSKGVMLSHANFWSASMTRGAELNNSPDSVTLLVAPLFHVAGLGRLVGQPTGGNQRGINGGAFFFLRLPNSHLEADLPLIARVAETAMPDAGLDPDVPVKRTVEGIASGRDEEMAAALALLQRER